MNSLSNQHFDKKRIKKLLNRFENFSLIISEIHKHLVKISAEEMKKYGLQGPSARILLILHKRGTYTAAALARKVEKNKAEISRTLVELEKKGFIEKENTSTNYRVTLKLTESGIETAKAIEEAAIKTVSAATIGLSDDDRAAMYRALDLISENLQKITKDTK